MFKNKKKITEADRLEKEWYKDTKEQTIKSLQEQATKILKEYPDEPSNPNRLHPSVREHMQSIVNGNVPFDFEINNN